MPNDDVARRPSKQPHPSINEPVAEPPTETDGADGGDAVPDAQATEGDDADCAADTNDQVGGDDSEPDGETAEDDDHDLDVEPYDELDEAAAQHKEDYRRPTRPWPDLVDGEALFVALVDCFSRFMILPPGAAEVLALWVIMTYALYACDLRFAVRIMITAPGANSGKTTLLDLLTYLVRHPDPTSDITPASFFRSANARKCVLVDECDHNLPSRSGTRNQLVQMINMGHKKTQAVVIRAENVKTPNGTVRVNHRYPIFGAVAMAGIGDFGPNTTKTRAFIIKLLRKMAHEQVDDFIPDEHAPMMRVLRSQTVRWVIDAKEGIRHCRPVLDRDLMNNRQRDNATMLLQIADTLGPRCAERAREAIKVMTSGDVLDPNETLLGDIATILTDREIVVGDPPKPIGHDNAVFSGDLCDLISLYYPHRETYQGFSQARLATMLRRFDIEPESRCKRRGSQVLHWYRRDAFDGPFVRYGFVDPAAEPVASAVEAVEGATPLRPEVPDQETAPQPAAPKIVYSKAHVVEAAKGDKRRGDRLRAAVDAVMRAGNAEPDSVVFTSARFWIVSRGGETCYVRLNGDNLEWHAIGERGLLADTGTHTVKVNRKTTLQMSDSEFLALRPLVGKARAAMTTQ